MTVSAALIVRDEENTLPHCLDSLSGAVDEIVIVDTGSKDKTLHVARRYTDRVFEFPWVKDFSAARQFAFDQAQGDWVTWFDADDVVYGARAIPALASGAPADVGAIYWPYITAWDAYGNPTCQFWRERMVRNDGSYQWEGRVHEVLTTRRGWRTANSSEVVVEHHPPPRDGAHTLRNLEILESEVAGFAGNPPARLLFYLGREYAANGQPEQALRTLAEHARRCTWGDERYMAILLEADIHLELGEYESVIDTLFQALKLCPHWPDAYFALAKTYYYRKDWHKVVHWTEVGRAMPWPETLLFTNPMDYRFNWIIYYTNALYNLNEVQAALEWTGQALKICPGDPMHRQNLAYFRESVSGG